MTLTDSTISESPSSPLVSVVLPAFRAADVLSRSVPPLLGYLDGLAITHEVIVVDDGSRDEGRTASVAQGLGCRYIALPGNTGKGAAVRRGMLAAKGRYRIFTDADVPFEFDTLKLMLHYLDFKEFDFVAGDRTLPESRYFATVPVARRIGSNICSAVVGRFMTTGWYDTQCGIKGFRDRVAEDLFGVSRIDRFAIDVELFYIALKRNYDIKRIPVRLRSNDTSSVKLLSDGLALVRDLARIRWNGFRGRYRQARPARHDGQMAVGEDNASRIG